MPQEIISKPENMSTEEYIRNYVTKYNKKFNKLFTEIKELNPEWKQLKINTSDETLDKEYANTYYLSNTGCLMVVNPNDVRNCHISKPYYNRATGNYQINLRLYDINGNEISHINRTIVKLIETTFGPQEAEIIRMLEYKIKQGENVVNLGDGEEV